MIKGVENIVLSKTFNQNYLLQFLFVFLSILKLIN